MWMQLPPRVAIFMPMPRKHELAKAKDRSYLGHVASCQGSIFERVPENGRVR